MSIKRIILFALIFTLLMLQISIQNVFADLPDDGKLLLKQGKEFLDKQEYEKALECYEKAVELYPNEIESYKRLGNCLEYMDDYYYAIDCYDKILAIDPANTEAYLNKITCLFQIEAYSDIIDMCDLLLIDSKTSEKTKLHLYIEKGKALYFKCRYQDAINNLNLASKIIESNMEYDILKMSDGEDVKYIYSSELIYYLGNSNYKLGKYEDALSCFNTLIKEKTFYSHQAYKGKADSLFSMGRYGEAVVAYEETSKYFLEDAESYYYKAMAYAKIGLASDAIESLKKAISLNSYYRDKAFYEAGFESINKLDSFVELLAITLKVNGQEIQSTIKPIIIKGRAYIPLTPDTSKAVGISFTRIPRSKYISVKKQNTNVLIDINNLDITVNNKKVKLDAAPKEIKGTIYIPDCLLNKAFGIKTYWNYDNYTFYITAGKNKMGYSNDQMEWALTMNSIVMRTNEWKLNIIGGGFKEQEYISKVDKILRNGWKVYDRTSALEAISFLKLEGERKDYDDLLKKFLAGENENNSRFEFIKNNHEEIGNKSLIAYDYSRIVTIAGLSYNMGYLSYEEAWTEIMNAAKVVQGKYSTWEEYGRHCMLGGEFMLGKEYSEVRAGAYNWLMTNQRSPWLKIKWDLSLKK